MKRLFTLKAGTALAAVLLVASGLVATGLSCGAPQPFVIPGGGPPVDLNERPTLTFLEPVASVTLGQGAGFTIRWGDSDVDDNALIAFSLVNIETGETIPLIEGIPEDDDIGPDSVQISTTIVPFGTYFLLGSINDDPTKAPVSVFAAVGGISANRLEITITEPDIGPITVPPSAAIIEPSFNLSLTQEDTLTVQVQPEDLLGNQPFDPDSDVTLFVLLDLDLIPTNDDPTLDEQPLDAFGNPTDIVVLCVTVIPLGTALIPPCVVTINLDDVPIRSDGKAYFVRATLDDGVNPPVHVYAPGEITIGRSASGLVDLFDVGRTLMGARFFGFNPSAHLGSEIAPLADFDADGIDDFVLVAQFGNSRGTGLVGEAYVIYGVPNRFGRSISVNSVSALNGISGVIIDGPPVVAGFFPGENRTDGITDFDIIGDLDGDGRPELLIGFAHVSGAHDGADWDTGDEDLTGQGTEMVTVDITVQRGSLEIVEDNFEFVGGYTGVQDVTVSTLGPTAFNTDELAWGDSGPAGQTFALIKFSGIRDLIPDPVTEIDRGTIEGSLNLRVFDTGPDAMVFQLFADFDETTTLQTLETVLGGVPVAIFDYAEDELDNLQADAIDDRQIEIDDLLALLLEGGLAEFGDELRFIIVAEQNLDDTDTAAVRSSEFNTVTVDRPTLTISYDKTSLPSRFGCYPDPFANNATDPADDLPADIYGYYGGMVTMLMSGNRDDDGLINPNRLERTLVNADRIGQRAGLVGDLTSVGGAQESTPLRVAGARFIAGGYDFIDADLLGQGAREGLWGQNVSSIGDLNNDDLPEIIISAPRNERYLFDLFNDFGPSTQWISTFWEGSITVIIGSDFDDEFWNDERSDTEGATTLPHVEGGQCLNPPGPRTLVSAESFSIFAEDLDDMLGDARSAGDVNLDGLDDILCGAPLNDLDGGHAETGATYVLYGRPLLGTIDLSLADDPVLRAPMIRIRGETEGDQIGWRQTKGLDVNGDRIDDVFFSSPRADFGSVSRTTCAVDFNGDGILNSADLSLVNFSACRSLVGDHVFTNDTCKAFDYDNDEDIDDDDMAVLDCLGQGGTDCCDNLVDNGFIGVIFGGTFLDGDRSISQLAKPDLPGVIFFGGSSGDRAGYDVASVGDFNEDGFGDLAITVPGEVRFDTSGRQRLGVVYLIFGGTHLTNRQFSLDLVGTPDLPGIVFISPYVTGRPNEAAPLRVSGIGDINGDGFDDMAIGSPLADFIDLNFPQGPDAPGSDAAVGRRSDAGDVYIIYGNNFGTNRGGS